MKNYHVLVDLFLYCVLTGELQDVYGCGGNYSGTTGSFTSPNYPLRYGGRLRCTYIVDAGSTLITLVFEEFNTQNFYDQVQVYDSDGNILAEIDGKRRGYIVQSAIYYRVVFRTNNWGTRKGFKAVWSLTTAEHARYGGYATLSWNLTQPGIREFTVWNSRSGEYILHITNYNNVRAVREKMASRIQFIGHITLSGIGLLRFVIHDIIWEDAGQYACYKGSMSSRGARIPDCGQELAVLGCGGHYNTASGSLSSPNYLDNTKMYFSCIYTIDAGSTYVTMVFEDLSTMRTMSRCILMDLIMPESLMTMHSSCEGNLQPLPHVINWAQV
ncbi:scavenger receptor cysteine-rich domain-containing protein DMBT1-like [Haliotis cracherodii]|uniref:scavenger receptor cysteine-rich domain-containing protein DMBT1-like n=1 Tax=Haliotis cracherodii TaxID=6455 RepID=UPI0039E7DF20